MSDLDDGDVRLVQHLRSGLNHEVTMVSDGSEQDLDGFDLLVVSQSSSSHVLGARFRDVPIPVLVLHDNLWDDMGLSGASGDTPHVSELSVLNESSPIVGGLQLGRHTAFSEEQSLRYVTALAPGGEPLVAAGDDLEQVVVFAFEKNAELRAGIAPERRVGFGARVGAYGEFLGPAWDIFDAAVGWLLGVEPRSGSSALLIVGSDQPGLNGSEWAVRSRLRAHGFEVAILSDQELQPGDADEFDVTVMSKTVDSATVGTKLKGTPTGVMFWEDNQQMLSMMATIDNTGEDGTEWHSAGTHIYVDADIGTEGLRAGLLGPVQLLLSTAEISYAPAGDLSAGAIPVARYGNSADDGRYVIYALAAGAMLSDGTEAQGRRLYFGLYDDTFRLLTGRGVALFDAGLDWVSGARP